MPVSFNQLNMTKAFEGCHKAVPGRPGFFAAYLDPVKVPTIGVGHTNHHEPKFTMGDVWSEAKCLEVLSADLRIFEKHVDKLAPGLPVPKRDALVDWAFNTGGPANSSVWTYVKKGDDAAVVERLNRWVNAGGRPLPGLIRRRKANGLTYVGDYVQALRVAGVNTFPTARRVDTPKVPTETVRRETRKEQAGAAAGGAAVGGGAASEVTKPATQTSTEQPTPMPVPVPATAGVSFWAMALGGTFLIVMLGLIGLRWYRLQRDYA